MDSKKNNSSKLDPITIFSIVGMVGIIIVAIIILVFFLKPEKDINPKETPQTDVYTDEPQVVEEDEGNQAFNRYFAIITNIDANNKKIYLYDIETEAKATVIMDGTVDIRDEYGQAITFRTLRMGDIVEAKVNQDTNIPESIKISGKTWMREEMTDVTIDLEKKTIELPGETLSFTDELIVSRDGLQIDLSEIDASDTLTLKGYRDKLWFVEKTIGHGDIQLMNYENFVGGMLNIGNKIRIEITAEMELKIPVGEYELTLEKEGMEPFITDISVSEGIKTVVDVQSAKPKEGLVNFIITPDKVQLFINDIEQASYSQPIPLKYGEYAIKVVKDAYVSYSGKIVVDSEKIDFKVNLAAAPMNINIDTPAGVEVYIDANFIGTIPIHSPISAGSHAITLRKDGYFSKMYQVQIEDTGKDVTFTFPELVIMEEGATDTNSTTGN